MRLGDYIICGNLALNMLAIAAYGYEDQWKMVWYWVSVASLNASLIWMR